MKILSIKIPQFKALTNVDLTFDKDLDLQTFLIGGFNGSGKSTLIQLVFLLLHKFWEDDFEKVYSKEILKYFPDKSTDIDIMDISLLIDDLNVNLSFYYSNRNNKITFRYSIVKNNQLLNLWDNKEQEIFTKIKNSIFLITLKETPLFFDKKFRKNITGIFNRMYFTNLFIYTDYIDLNMMQYAKILDDIKKNSLINSVGTINIDTVGRSRILTDELSSGELKRLVIYFLLKHKIPKDSVILMDNIDDSFHPRIQRYLPDDLINWNNSQYILPTHSYEICRGVTLGHIKEI